MYNYYPYGNPITGFQPNYYNPAQFQTQPQMQQNQFSQPFAQGSFTQNQNAQTPINTNKIFVNGIDDVRNRALPYNSDYIFLDNDKDIMYRKTTDATGRTSVYSYKISEINNNDVQATNNVDTSKFALKEDVESLRNELNSYKASTQHINEDIAARM